LNKRTHLDYQRNLLNLSSWFPFALVCLLGAMSPGPSLATVIRNTVIGSRYHGIATGVSHALGIGFYAFLSVTGLMILIREAPLVFQVLTWLGAAYLIWLGWQGLTAKKSLIDQNENQISTLQISSAAMDGLAISLLNPKITAFFLALFSQFVDQATNLLNSSIIVATPMLIDGLWYSLIAIFVSQKFLLTKLRKHGVWFNRGIGVLLILIALRVFFNDPLI